jgi:inorganic pyrophosphatase
VPEDSVVFEHVKDIKDFSAQHNQQLRDFFINYTKAENKRLVNLKYVSAGNARKNLEKSAQ